MSWWKYEFITLTEDQKHLRRLTLDHYALIAHLSAYIPFLTVFLLRSISPLRRWVWGHYRPIATLTNWGGTSFENEPDYRPRGLERLLRKAAWRLGDDVYFAGSHWGQVGQWVFGGIWALWLLALSFGDTGTDYLHLTKRVGIIAASQLPIQYLLSLKALNPFAWLLSSSHEEINRFHRPLGRIIYALLIVHAVLYNVYFFGVGIWLRRFFAPVVFAGVLAFLALHTLNGTSQASVRRDSYRIFFITHLVCALSIPLLLLYHAAPARPYVGLAIASFCADVAFRKLVNSTTAPAIVETIPGTDLLKVRVCLPPSRAKVFAARPGSHAYLSLPAGSRPTKGALVFEALYNPFTVASVNPDSGETTFIVRSRSGPFTTHLADVASVPPPSETAKINICVEGPYGAAAKTLASSSSVTEQIDRVLLVAGGVGATFTIDVHRARMLHLHRYELPSTRDRFVWAMRSSAEEAWVTGPASTGTIHDGEGVQVYVTGEKDVPGTGDADEENDATEMSQLHRGDGFRRRPDIASIVDDMFSGQDRDGFPTGPDDEHVAIFVCGPDEMAKEVRKCVRPWVMKGRRVWYHNEAFGW